MGDREERVKAVREFGHAHEVTDEILSRVTEDRVLSPSEAKELTDARTVEDVAGERWIASQFDRE